MVSSIDPSSIDHYLAVLVGHHRSSGIPTGKGTRNTKLRNK